MEAGLQYRISDREAIDSAQFVEVDVRERVEDLGGQLVGGPVGGRERHLVGLPLLRRLRHAVLGALGAALAALRALTRLRRRRPRLQLRDLFLCHRCLRQHHLCKYKYKYNSEQITVILGRVFLDYTSTDTVYILVLCGLKVSTVLVCTVQVLFGNSL